MRCGSPEPPLTIDVVALLLVKLDLPLQGRHLTSSIHHQFQLPLPLLRRRPCSLPCPLFAGVAPAAAVSTPSLARPTMVPPGNPTSCELDSLVMLYKPTT